VREGVRRRAENGGRFVTIKPGVVVLQLGGPETLDDVRPFLYNFFCDLLADNAPGPLIKPLAALISTWRAPYSRGLYASIGGGSPIRAQTQAQADALRDELRRRHADWPVYVAMRNWHPFIADTVAEMKADGIAHARVLCLAPQNSRTSVGLYRSAVTGA